MFWNAKFQVVDVVAKLELAKANVGDVVQLQSPAAKILKRPLDNFYLKRFLDKRYPLTRNSFPQRRKAVAQVRTGGPSVPLPAQGTLMDVLKNNGQHFSRDLVSSCRRRRKAGVAGVYTRLSRICLDPFNIDVDVKLMKMAVQREGCLVSSDFVACCD
jgi:hypothetical protein